MKNLLAVAVLVSALVAFPPRARADVRWPVPTTYVSVTTFTAGGAAGPVKIWSFQNTSTTRDVRILKLEVSNASTGTYTGGLMQFWLYGSTTIATGGTSQSSFWDYQAPNTTAPSFITVSTGPAVINYEGAQGAQLPLYRPLIVNDDETATANFTDELRFFSPADAAELVLPYNSQRGLILEQRRLGTADVSAGTVMVRVVYSVK